MRPYHSRGCFLIRERESGDGFTLSMKDQGTSMFDEVVHYKIFEILEKSPDGVEKRSYYFNKEDETHFSSLEDLVTSCQSGTYGLRCILTSQCKHCIS